MTANGDVVRCGCGRECGLSWIATPFNRRQKLSVECPHSPKNRRAAERSVERECGCKARCGRRWIPAEHPRSRNLHPECVKATTQARKVGVDGVCKCGCGLPVNNKWGRLYARRCPTQADVKTKQLERLARTLTAGNKTAEPVPCKCGCGLTFAWERGRLYAPDCPNGEARRKKQALNSADKRNVRERMDREALKRAGKKKACDVCCDMPWRRPEGWRCKGCLKAYAPEAPAERSNGFDHRYDLGGAIV